MKKIIITDKISVETEGGMLTLPLQPLPEKCVDWMIAGRRHLYKLILENKHEVRFFQAHLPVLVTSVPEGPFISNCANKGVGFLPKEEHLSRFIELFSAALEKTRGKPWRESLQTRLETVSKLFLDREKIDRRVLGSLEIFKKQTYRNILANPLAAMHFTGSKPEYISFQLNCAVEVAEPGDKRYEFIKLSRTLFEYDDFHLTQDRFRCAYLFWISEFVDKQPVSLAKKSVTREIIVETGLKWEKDALDAIRRAPGMIQGFIRERIEAYAQRENIATINSEVVRAAREQMENRMVESPHEAGDKSLSPYQKICVALDSSECANHAMETAIAIGKMNNAKMTGAHVYAARLHDDRFKAMEGGLPEKYQKEDELNKQRDIHDSLITQGLELITDSYLDAMKKTCDRGGLVFKGVSLEGRNYERLAGEASSGHYDLLAMGASGVGKAARTRLGSVAERVLRRVGCDTLICRQSYLESPSDTIIACLDGSPKSWGSLIRAFQLAKMFGKRVLAISVFDPHFHYVMFSSLNRTLSQKAREAFNLKQQEKLHEELIDSGLAKIYHSHLKIAEKLAGEKGWPLDTRLLDGKVYDRVLDFIEKNPPWLLALGRTGIHSPPGMDIGGNTENICRGAGCNILVVSSEYSLPSKYQVEETVTWTKEAKLRMANVPKNFRTMAMRSVADYCLDKGHTVVTESLLREAFKALLPESMLDKMEPMDSEPGGNRAGSGSWKCRACGHESKSAFQQCPVCGADASAKGRGG